MFSLFRKYVLRFASDDSGNQEPLRTSPRKLHEDSPTLGQSEPWRPRIDKFFDLDRVLD